MSLIPLTIYQNLSQFAYKYSKKYTGSKKLTLWQGGSTLTAPLGCDIDLYIWLNPLFY